MAQAVINVDPTSLHQSVMQGLDADPQKVRLTASCLFAGVGSEPTDPGTSGCPTILFSDGLPDSTQGAAYSGSITASGGQSPYRYSVIAGSLPDGLTLNASTGAITGTTTTPGTFNFTIRALDDRGCYSDVAFDVIVTACPTITLDDTLPDAVVSTAYSGSVIATGGANPTTYTVTSGSLPTGLTLASNGTVSGTPSAAGTFNFTITATDSNGCTGSRAYTVITNDPAPCTCPDGLAGSYTITGTAQVYSGPNGTGSLVHTINVNFAASATQNQCEWYGGNDDGLVYAQMDGSSRPCPWHIWLSGLYLPNVWFYTFHMYKASGATPVGNYGDSAWYNDTYGGGGSIKFFGVQVQ